MAKIDIESAYRLISVHPTDRTLQAMEWKGKTRWFQVQWDQRAAALQIMVKELIPIVLACMVWGSQWHSHHVLCLCDKQAEW